MPLFYFDIHDGKGLNRDDEGLEFSDLRAARDDLSRALGEITKDVMPDGDHREIIGEIRDETGKPVLRATVTFKVESL